MNHNDSKLIKSRIQKEVFDSITKINGVISVTLVGSFIDRADLSGISDIDTIVICNKLSEKFYTDCINSVKKINLNKCGLVDYSLRINSTFGPLKFDKPNTVVIHLMIYDVRLHIDHVIASPFTCFDWERSCAKFGPSLKEIFPVGTLQYRDFLEVRRSLESYLNDLSKNIITYREYDFKSGDGFQRKKSLPLDKRHRGEYAYHIIKNTITNYMKMINGENKSFEEKQIVDDLKKIFSQEKENFVEKYKLITSIKLKRESDFPKDTLKWTSLFLDKFQSKISKKWKGSIPIYFIRHFKTPLNDGKFLGQGRNPGIDIKNQCKNKFKKTSRIYSSELRRSIETAKSIFKTENIIEDERLNEFNYGDVEGLTLTEMAKKYPNIISDWEKGLDPNFPSGENTKDLARRLKSFLVELGKNIDEGENNSVSIITHNGVLRCLIGNYFNISKKDWYKIVIPHGEALEFLYFKNQFYPNIKRNLIRKFFMNLSYNQV
jgi:ribonuclease H / adenosylcobalamin/alpha-ribazole phosphatase